MLHYFSTYRPPGNPTKLAPIPKPAPERTELAMAGTNVSSIENVHAALDLQLAKVEITYTSDQQMSKSK